MTSNGTSPKRWRPRFSLRTLVIFVTFVCCYFGAWEATKRYVQLEIFTRRADSREFTFDIRAPMPLVVVKDQAIQELPYYSILRKPLTGPRRYYLWLFGPLVELPFESTWKIEK